jgi:hypothetical protein
MSIKVLNKELDKIIRDETIADKKNKLISDAVLRKYWRARSSRDIEEKQRMIDVYNEIKNGKTKVKQDDFSSLKKKVVAKKEEKKAEPEPKVAKTERQHKQYHAKVINFTFDKDGTFKSRIKEALEHMKEHPDKKYYVSSKTEYGFKNFGKKPLTAKELEDILSMPEFNNDDHDDYWTKVISKNHKTSGITLISS